MKYNFCSEQLWVAHSTSEKISSWNDPEATSLRDAVKICLVTNLTRLFSEEWLDGKQTKFGRVQTGMRTGKIIGRVETDNDDRSVDDAKIVRASTIM